MRIYRSPLTQQITFGNLHSQRRIPEERAITKSCIKSRRAIVELVTAGKKWKKSNSFFIDADERPNELQNLTGDGS